MASHSKASDLPDGVQEHYISDDGNVHIPLPFAFPYYGQVFTDSWMFSNGVVGFLSPQTSWCCSGEDLTNPNNHRPSWNFAMMPLWTDLRNYNGRFLTEGTKEYQRYVWENISEFGRPDSSNTFGVEILPSGEWSFYHQEIDITRPYTIGATGDLSLGQYQQFGYYPQGNNYTGEWTPIIGDPNPTNICDADPLADPSCPGYAEAYHEQQCSYDPLYDATCTGYEQAYHDLQCSYDPLYNATCEGYATAYHEQQCSLDPLYDNTCEGYAEAYINTYVETEEQETATTTASTTSTVTDAEDITETPVTGDSTVDSILRETTNATTNQVVDSGLGVPLPEMEAGSEPEEVREDQVSQEEQVEEELVAVEESVDETTETEETTDTETTSDESGGEVADGSNTSDSDRSGSESRDDKKESKREKIKKALAEKAKSLANDMANAATLEAQQAAQAQLLSIINYVQGFNAYSVQMNGGLYPDNNFYTPETMPESRSGLRNGLAQQLLHEKMVQSQYE